MSIIDTSDYEDLDNIPVTKLLWNEQEHHWESQEDTFLGYDALKRTFYAEASDFGLMDYPSQVMLRFGHEEYIFKFLKNIRYQDELAAVEYQGVDIEEKLLLFND